MLATERYRNGIMNYSLHIDSTENRINQSEESFTLRPLCAITFAQLKNSTLSAHRPPPPTQICIDVQVKERMHDYCILYYFTSLD